MNLSSEKPIARVYLTDTSPGADALYDYFIPDGLRFDALPGRFAVVPFGGGNRREVALIMDLAEDTDVPREKLKPIESVISGAVSLDDEMLGLCAFMRDHAFCTVGEAVHTIIPAPALIKINEIYEANEIPGGITLSDKEKLVYDAIESAKKISLRKLKETFGAITLKTVRALREIGAIAETVEYTDGGDGKYVEIYSLAISPDEVDSYIDGDKKLRSVKMREILRLLATNEQLTTDELKVQLSATKSQLNSLCAKKLISQTRERLYRDPYSAEAAPPADNNILNDGQENAAMELTALLESGEAKAALLQGVTGSGKTRVIKRLCDAVIKSGQGVIILVPEIGLTPQSVMFFRSYYGDRVVVIHSSLSAGERFDAWQKMKNGGADICIGTRSAVFSPFPKIGMIVIDEEQEHTYKSDMSPRYHTKDIARFRCAHHKALMLLASATPSLESRRKAETGVYSLLRLTERYGGALLPKTLIFDTRPDAQNGYTGAISSALRLEIEKNLAASEQTILFLNRRGYNSFLRCPLCGEVVMCPECSVSLTYHTSGVNRGLLCCHYCGHRDAPPASCLKCGANHMSYQGFGTQRVEEELNSFFPSARIMRMDADTTSAKFAVDDILARFRSGDADILLGTQMVAKGHDFPKVSLVGVLSADMSLYLDDYRANEKTFALLTQVIGRAGRADTGGRAVIQTFSPNHPVLQMAATQDYDEFYLNEIALRQALVFPPFCDMVSVTLTSTSEVEAAAAAVKFDAKIKQLLLEKYSGQKIILFGPFEAPLYKLNGRYRMRIVIKCRMNAATRSLFAELNKAFAPAFYKKANISIDINPNSM